MTAYTFVAGAERMLTAVALGQDGLRVRFADDREGVIPWQELGLTEPAVGVNLPRPHVIEVQMASGVVAEVPWDFARHFACAGYRATSEAAANRGRRVVAERVRTLRSRRGLSQRALAERARVTRVSVSRSRPGITCPASARWRPWQGRCRWVWRNWLGVARIDGPDVIPGLPWPLARARLGW